MHMSEDAPGDEPTLQAAGSSSLTLRWRVPLLELVYVCIIDFELDAIR